MSQRWSPALHFPLPQRTGLVWIIVCVAVVQVAALVAWLLVGSGHCLDSWWVHGLAAIAVSALALVASFSLWESWPQGMLCWVQGEWTFENSRHVMPLIVGQPQVVLDLGVALCVCFKCVNKGSLYVWLQRRGSPDNWGDLRRAVYSSANTS